MKRNERLIENIREIYKENKDIFIVGYGGMDMKNLDDLRAKLYQIGGVMKIVKNSLSKIVNRELSYEIDEEIYKGQVAIIYGSNMVSTAKVVSEYSKKNKKLKLLGCYVENRYEKGEYIEILSKLPTIEEARSMLVGIISSLGRKIAILTKKPLSNIVVLLNEHNKNKNI